MIGTINSADLSIFALDLKVFIPGIISLPFFLPADYERSRAKKYKDARL